MATTIPTHSYEEFRREYMGQFGEEPAAEDVTVTKYWDTKTGEYRYTTDAEKIPMANKFLPFIVESSTPLHIFKTLLSRSKGMNEVLIASIFYLVLSVDIKKLRSQVKEMPEMQLEKLYQELVTKYSQYQMDDSLIASFRNIIKYFPEGNHWDTELDIFESKDIMTFLAVLCFAGKDISNYTKYSFSKLVTVDPDEVRTVMRNIHQHVLFSDSAEKRTFKNKEDLASFIIYESLLKYEVEPDRPTPIKCCAVLESVES